MEKPKKTSPGHFDLMREVGFDSSALCSSTGTSRHGCLARTKPDNIDETVKIERLNRMIALQNELSLTSILPT